MLLNTFQSASTSILAKALYSVLLVAAVIGLGMMDYNGVFRNGVHSDTVAVVAGDHITTVEFDNSVRSALSQMRLDPKMAYRMGYINQILEKQISQRLVTRSTYDLGIQASDDLVAREVSKELDEIRKSGKAGNMSKDDILRTILRNQGQTEAQFAQGMRVQTADNLVVQALQLNASAPPDEELRDIYRFQHEQRTLKYVALPDSALKDFKDPDDSVLKPLYETGKERFAIPEARSFSMLVLTGDALKNKVGISDDDLKNAYDESSSAYSTPERRVVQQSVFKDKNTAETVAEKVKKGASLKDAATAAGGKEAWIGEMKTERGGLPPAIGAAVFGGAKGDVVGPAQTPLGWDVVVVKDILPGKTESFDEAKEEIRKELLATRISEELYKMSGQLDDKLSGGASLEDTAKDTGATIKKFGAVQQNGTSPDGKNVLNDYSKDSSQILKNLFDLSEGESSSVIELKDGSYAAIRADHITPKTYKPYESVKAEIKKGWIASHQNELNMARAKAALQALQAGKTTLDKLAQENHAEAKTATIELAAEETDTFPRQARQTFFTLGKGDYGLARSKDGYVVAQVTAIKLPDPDKIPAGELKDLAKATEESAQSQYVTAYVGWLRTRYKVTVNKEVLKQMYGSDDDADGQE